MTFVVGVRGCRVRNKQGGSFDGLTRVEPALRVMVSLESRR